MANAGLLQELLEEGQDLSAVDVFARWHDTHPSRPYADRYRDLIPHTPMDGQQYAFEVDLDACSGCKACVIACHHRNGLENDETWRRVGQLQSQAGLPILQTITAACHHCVEPGCMKGCPVQAYVKEEATGIVRHLDDQCFGCQYCIMMCPYEVPQYRNDLGIVRKCDMCSQRLREGEAPACVAGCPHQAIRITLVDTRPMSKDAIEAFEKNRSVDGVTPQDLGMDAPRDEMTLPTTRFVTKVAGKAEAMATSVDFSIERPRGEHAHWPLIAMLLLTQWSVGLWMGLLVSFAIPTESATRAALAATAWMTGVAGVLVAPLHLGRPWLAFRGVLGWRTSWLSREALAFGPYLMTSFLAWIRMDSKDGFAWLLLASVTGGIAVSCSAMVYVATRRFLWSAWRTLTDFLGTVAWSVSAVLLFCNLESDAFLFELSALCVLQSALMASWMMPWWIGKSSEHQRLLNRWLALCSTPKFLAVLITLFSVTIACNVWGLVMGALFEIEDRFVGSCILVLAMAAFQIPLRWFFFASIVFPRMPGAHR